MPMYEYRCVKGHVTEELRKMEDRDMVGGCSLCGWSTIPVPTAPAAPRFAIPGVKGHYKKSTTELPNG